MVDQVSLLFQQMLLARQLSFGALGIEMPLLDRPDIWEHVPEEERVNNSLAYVLFAKSTYDPLGVVWIFLIGFQQTLQD